MNKYEDIIHLKRPPSRHMKMSLDDRAKIFAPFAALKGYDEAIEDKQTVYIQRPYLSEDEQNHINSILNSIHKNDMVKVMYFKEDHDDMGMMMTLTGKISSIDDIYHTLTIIKTMIHFKDLYTIEKV